MPLAPGGVLMAFVFRARDRLSSGSVGPITRRSATALALGAALAAAVLALAAGIAIGKYWSARGVSGMQSANRIERDYAIDQLGKLNASVAQIEPRIARLTAQVGALRDFETRLNTPRPAPLAPVASPAASPGAASRPGVLHRIDRQPGNQRQRQQRRSAADRALSKSLRLSRGHACTAAPRGSRA